MTASQIVVAAAGAAAIAWINWYFFVARRSSARAAIGTDGRQEVVVTVKGGYDPGEIRIRAGAPVRLVFDRRETNSCSEEIVIPAFSVRRFLPPHTRTAVDLEAPAAGRYEMSCGMGMLHGTLIAE